MKAAVLSIIVDIKNQVEIRFEGDDILQLSMLWWIDVAKDWLLNRMKSVWNISDSEQWFEQSEISVGKREAIAKYTDLVNTIKVRIDAIHAADENAIFQIDKNLLQNL